MSNPTYWERRQIQNMYEYMEGTEKAAEQISKMYLRASRYLSMQADDIFEKYQAKHGLSEAEARRLINELQDKTSIDELLKKLKNVVQDESRKELIAKLEASAYSARLENFRQLQDQLDIVMRDVYQQEKDFSTNYYKDLANEAYYRGIFDIQQRANAAFSFSHLDSKQIGLVINSKWSGNNYSSRIWGNTRALAQDIKEELLINLVTGRSNREAAEIISNKFGQGASVARRLIRTESNYLSGEMNFKAYEECSIEKYQYLATLDLKTSKACQELDGKIFLVKDRKVGVNCNPVHPWCRSTTISVVDESLIKDMQRRAKDPATGESILVPRSMNYKEWYDKYVRGNKDVELKEKQIQNATADRKQHENYKHVLGDKIPDKLDDFQRMKYNDSEGWRYRKLDYSRQKKLIDNPTLKLPGSENAILPDAKFTKYLFDGSNAEGLAKGSAIDSRLGYNLNNWKEFRNGLASSAAKYPVSLRGNNGYGDLYEQKIVLYGLRGKPANLIVGWLHKPDGTMNLASAYIKEV